MINNIQTNKNKERERERQRDRDRDRDRDRQRQTEKQTDRQRNRERRGGGVYILAPLFLPSPSAFSGHCNQSTDKVNESKHLNVLLKMNRYCLCLFFVISPTINKIGTRYSEISKQNEAPSDGTESTCK